jgi:hypothetical protein
MAGVPEGDVEGLEPEAEPWREEVRPVLTAELERRLEEALVSLSARLDSLGAEPPPGEGPGTVVLRVMGRMRGRKTPLPLSGVRVRFGWRRQQVEVLTDIAGWAVARLPAGMKSGVYRVSVLRRDGKVLAFRRGMVSHGQALLVHHLELGAHPELRESFERAEQWREAVARAVLQVNEPLSHIRG